MIGAGTLQSDMADIRAAIRGSRKKRHLADHKDLSNKSLGIPSRSRTGVRIPPSIRLFQQGIEKAATKCIGTALALCLCHYLGLRIQEAVRSNVSLETWLKQLKATGKIVVIYGTKGGRHRVVYVLNVEAALEAIRNALEFTKRNDGLLVPGSSLRSACNRASRVASWAGFRGVHSPHSLRYAFAVDQFDGYFAQGFTRQEAQTRVAQDLGHGDTRGRWAWSVYLRSCH